MHVIFSLHAGFNLIWFHFSALVFICPLGFEFWVRFSARFILFFWLHIGFISAVCKRPSSALRYSETSALIPSNANMLMFPSNMAMAGGLVHPPSPSMAGGAHSSRMPSFLRPSNNGQEIFSRKVFVGGLPMDISEGCISMLAVFMGCMLGNHLLVLCMDWISVWAFGVHIERSSTNMRVPEIQHENNWFFSFR